MTTDGQNAGTEIPRTEIPAEEKRLLAGVEPRIRRTTLILGVAGTLGFLLWRRIGWAGGFAVGAALSALSFHLMKTAIGAIADAIPIASSEGAPAARSAISARGAASRFVLRYALIAIAGYVIFRSSVLSLPAYFAGLFVAIAAVLVEIAYQVYLGFRNG